MTFREKYGHLPPDIEGRPAALTEVVRCHQAELVYLLGSAAKGAAGEGFFPTDFYADVFPALGTDRRAPVWLQWEVVTTGRPIFSRSQLGRLVFERSVRARYRDERPRLLRREFTWAALAELGRVAAELGKYRDLTPEDLAANLSLRWAVGRVVGTCEGLLAELRACGVISEDLYRRLKGAGAFGDILVHGYLQVDLGRVARASKEAPDLFRAFREEVGATGRTNREKARLWPRV